MGTVTEEVADIEQREGWNKLFQDIKKISSQYNFSCQAAKLQENRGKNRYRDVCPYDHSRVKLNAGPSDYINSCLVEVKDAGRKYILSQGPLPNTSGQFWQMVWEQNTKAVIMLNKVVEKGMIKCHHYWPIDSQHSLHFNDEGYGVALKNESDMENFVIREIELINMKTDERRTIFQFHFVAWPDFDVPQSPAAFLDFLACIRQYNVLENEPAVIHCSAGIGRSGTFALVDTCLEYLQKGLSFDIYKTLLEMRKYRMGLVQTPHQLRFSYFAIAECERILLYKQSDEDSYSEGAPSEDYDFLYDGEAEDDELVTNGMAMPNGRKSDSESEASKNSPENEKTYIEKETTKLNNNLPDSLKIIPDQEVEIKSTTKEPAGQKNEDKQETKPVEINGSDKADEYDRFDSVPSENDIELVNSSPASTFEAENSLNTIQTDQETDTKQEESAGRRDRTREDAKRTSDQVPSELSENIETENDREKEPIAMSRVQSLDANQSERDNFKKLDGIEKTVNFRERTENGYKTSPQDDDERTWKMYLLGGLVLSLVFSLIYSAYK